MTHLFLTGPVQIGKSTAICRALARSGLTAGGFRTLFGPDRNRPDHLLYLCPAGGEPALTEDQAVVRFTAGAAEPIPGRFDTLGTVALSCPSADLILMDECGRLERDALRFQARALELLDGRRPVLGVVRTGFPGWTKRIVSHPSVQLLTVTEENREAVPDLILRWMEEQGLLP